MLVDEVVVRYDYWCCVLWCKPNKSTRYSNFSRRKQTGSKWLFECMFLCRCCWCCGATHLVKPCGEILITSDWPGGKDFEIRQDPTDFWNPKSELLFFRSEDKYHLWWGIISRLLLGNLSFTITDSLLNDHLNSTIIHIKWITDKETGRFYGSPFCKVKTSKDAAKAITEINGSKVIWDVPLKSITLPINQVRRMIGRQSNAW